MKKIVLLFLIVTPFNIIRSQVQNPEFQWARSLGSPYEDYGNSVAVDLSDNVYITGIMSGDIDFDPSSNTVNVSAAYNNSFLAKYDASGAYQWAFSLGGTGNPVSAECVETDASGNVYIYGNYSNTVDFDPSASQSNLGPAYHNIFLAKYDSNGNFLWAYSLDHSEDFYSKAEGMDIDASGNVYVTGRYHGTMDFDPSPAVANLTSVGSQKDDTFLAKYNANGNYLWAISFGGLEYTIPSSLALDASGNAYVTGIYTGTVDFDPTANIENYTSIGTNDIFLCKYNSNGIYQWTIPIGSPSHDEANSVAIDAMGNAYITGRICSSADLDPSPATVNLIPTGLCDPFLAKYDSNGSLVWANCMGVTNEGGGHSLTIDASNNIYLAGRFDGTLDVDPSANTENIISIGMADIFLAKYDADGSYNWAIPISRGGVGWNDGGLGLALDHSDNIYFFGSFTDGCQFSTGSGTIGIGSVGQSDIFLAKYKDTLAGNTSINNTLTETDILSVYPNPANNILIIEHKDFKPLTFEIVNALGQKTLNGQLTSEKTILDISHLQPGIYLLKINDEVNCKMIKVIKK